MSVRSACVPVKSLSLVKRFAFIASGPSPLALIVRRNGHALASLTWQSPANFPRTLDRIFLN